MQRKKELAENPIKSKITKIIFIMKKILLVTILYLLIANFAFSQSNQSEWTRTGSDSTLRVAIWRLMPSSKVDSLVKKMNGYEVLKPGQVILWNSLPKVCISELDDEGDIGINILAFSIGPYVKGNYAMVGEKKYIKPGAATLIFDDWTVFDGYLAKGSAAITEKGLVFDNNSKVIRKCPKK
jgi:hypothetical protein